MGAAPVSDAFGNTSARLAEQRSLAAGKAGNARSVPWWFQRQAGSECDAMAAVPTTDSGGNTRRQQRRQLEE